MDKSRRIIAIRIVAAEVDHIRILLIVDVIDADIDSTATTFETAMEIGGDVETMVVGHTEIVTAFDNIETLSVSVFVVVVGVGIDARIGGHRERSRIASGEDPSGGNVVIVIELIGEDDREVVTTVVLGGEGFTTVELLPFAVEEVH